MLENPILETIMSKNATTEIFMELLSVVLFLGLALYAIHMRKKSNANATHGLRLVRDGFLMASVLSLVAILSEGTFSPTLKNYIADGTTLGSAISILVALRGLSQWHSATQPHRVTTQNNNKVSGSQQAIRTSFAATNKFVSFVDTCLSWSKNTSHLMNPHSLAESFLKILDESQGVQNSLLALTAKANGNIASAPILLATRGIDTKTGQKILSQALASESRTTVGLRGIQGQLQISATANIILLSQYDRRFTEKQKTLSLGLRLFGAALKKQSLARQITQLESKKHIAEFVQRAFKKTFKKLLNSNSTKSEMPTTSSGEIKTTQIVFETLIETLRDLGNDLVPANFIAVEYSNTESERTGSLSQSFSAGIASHNAQPRIGFYPHTRRLWFNSPNKTSAALIKTLPIYDSRPHWQRITSEHLSAIIHGTIIIDSQSELVVVIGTKAKNVFGESQLEVVNQIISELQSLIHYIKQPASLTSITTERRSSLADIIQNASSSGVNSHSRQESTLSLSNAPLTSSTT